MRSWGRRERRLSFRKGGIALLSGKCMGRDKKGKSGLSELARVLVRFDHVACLIVNANHSVM
jgi:hypothetical protein